MRAGGGRVKRGRARAAPEQEAPIDSGVAESAVRPPTSHVRAVRGSTEERQRWIRLLPRFFGGDEQEAAGGNAPTRTLKANDRVGVYAARLADREFVVKCWRLALPLDRLHAIVGTSRAHRHWNGAARLADIAIPTARCLAIVRGRDANGPVEALVMRRVEGATLLEHLAADSLPPRAAHRVAERLASHGAAMARAGVFNRDPKPSNLIVTHTDSRSAEVVMIDTVAIRPLPGIRVNPDRAPLERLVIEAIGVGATPRRGPMARFVLEWTRRTRNVPEETPRSDPNWKQARLELWRTLAARILAHGDPTPRDNPLAT